MSGTVQGSSARSRAMDLCAVTDVLDGGVLEVIVDRRRFGVARIGDRIFVFSGSCPHRGGPLGRGRLRPSVTSDCPGQIRADPTRPVVTCPWHNWEYDLGTGQALYDPRLKVPVFESETRDGRVFILL